MTARFIRHSAVTGAALTVLMGTALSWGAPPASAAENAPVSWESAALGLPTAHTLNQGEGVTVAVLDSGIDPDHPALKGRVAKVGPDFYDSDGLRPGDDGYGVHGTAMVSDVLKVAPKAKIITARVIDDSHEYKFERGLSPVGDGIDYAVANGADVISMSLGGDVVNRMQGEDLAAAARAVQKGVTLLAAAGNSGDEGNEGNFPAGYANVISVAATKQGGQRADFSTVRTHNTIAAPGVGIVSADKEGGYSAINGTSPATAIAAGVTALMLAENPDLTPAQTRAILMRTADHPAGGHDPLVGAGQINAAAAVRAAANPSKIDTEPKPYKGDVKHFASPTGTDKISHPAMETGVLATGLGAVGGGLLLVVCGGLLLFRRSKRQRVAV
ncbi:serine protease membrane protein [Streptomyces viridochromogenes]|uniref:Serine protease membrane protein n=1 Tax=Streptomyces viridochromogenes TaxID=1938 RepID=A0A0J7Z4E4_STRVR|nr:S8 family serine peptidase [Streptomyces viridochromogenes]KMS70649.1 serine protease membrane protein [Streptomyces viridochromogenes]KOG16770.1 serine protease membrane protein [Streptomyces viridochromogenes]KOG17954.1 serine protease membrane protein [Streptomyces viridochromogenes]